MFPKLPWRLSGSLRGFCLPILVLLLCEVEDLVAGVRAYHALTLPVRIVTRCVYYDNRTGDTKRPWWSSLVTLGTRSTRKQSAKIIFSSVESPFMVLPSNDDLQLAAKVLQDTYNQVVASSAGGGTLDSLEWRSQTDGDNKVPWKSDEAEYIGPRDQRRLRTVSTIVENRGRKDANKLEITKPLWSDRWTKKAPDASLRLRGNRDLVSTLAGYHGSVTEGITRVDVFTGVWTCEYCGSDPEDNSCNGDDDGDHSSPHDATTDQVQDMDALTTKAELYHKDAAKLSTLTTQKLVEGVEGEESGWERAFVEGLQEIGGFVSVQSCQIELHVEHA